MAHSELYEYTNKQSYAHAPIRTIPVWIDSSFGDADQISLDAAISSWNYALNGYIKFAVITNYYHIPANPHEGSANSDGLLIMKINAANPPVPIPEHPARVWAFCDDIGGHRIFVIRNRMENDQVGGVILHELGHILGARHVYGDDHLMFRYYSENGNACIDYNAIQQVANYNHIPIDNLNYCIKGR